MIASCDAAGGAAGTASDRPCNGARAEAAAAGPPAGRRGLDAATGNNSPLPHFMNDSPGSF